MLQHIFYCMFCICLKSTVLLLLTMTHILVGCFFVWLFVFCLGSFSGFRCFLFSLFLRFLWSCCSSLFILPRPLLSSPCLSFFLVFGFVFFFFFVVSPLFFPPVFVFFPFCFCFPFLFVFFFSCFGCCCFVVLVVFYILKKR